MKILPQPSVPPLPAPETMNTRCDVLLVDDDPLLARTLADLLRRHGYEVAVAHHGREAMRQLEKGRVGLVITDVFMPDCDGIELLAWVRRLTPAPPVLAISGTGITRIDGMLKIASSLGAARTIAKPFASSDFLALVQELVGLPFTVRPANARDRAAQA